MGDSSRPTSAASACPDRLERAPPGLDRPWLGRCRILADRPRPPRAPGPAGVRLLAPVGAARPGGVWRHRDFCDLGRRAYRGPSKAVDLRTLTRFKQSPELATE